MGSTETQADHAANRYGFTHQEMLDNVGIIHMNGRIYDPNLGRFLSVDPVFEFPTNTQSLNPYSYVLNNPLSLTDPTGYVADSCGTGKTSCTDSITVKTTAHELGSHIATHGNTTFTGTLDKNGNLHVSASGNGFGLGQTAEVTVASHGGNGAQNSSQGPGTGQTLGNSSNQGANTAPASSGNVAQANAATGSHTQPGHFLNDQELKQFMEMTYSGTQGSDPGVETVYTTDVNGKVLIKTQAGCEEAKCDLLNPPSGSAVGGHTHVYPEELRGLRVGQVFDASQKAAMLARDMPGPGDAAFTGGPGELITPSNAHYSFEGTPQNTIMRYRGGGDANWGKYVQKYWHQGMTDTDNYNLASQYLRGPP